MADLKINPAEIVEECNALDTRTHALRDRFETDMALFTTQDYNVPTEEGEYEAATTTRPGVFGRKVVSIIGDGKPAFKINIEAESEVKRKAISMTERFAYYAIAQADKRLRAILQPRIHAQASFYVPIRGMAIPRVFVYPDDKDGKKPVFDVAFFDPLYTYWWVGADGLLQVVAKRWASEREINESYPKLNVSPDTQGRIEVWDFINKDFECPIINNEWAGDPYEHGLDRVPVGIIGNEATPAIQSDDITDPYQYQWESVYAGNRKLYKTSSRIFSYYLTTVSDGVHGPWTLEFDSSKGNEIPDIKNYPGYKGMVNPVDVGKGQKLIPPVTQTMPKDAFGLWQIVDGMLSMNELSKVSYGQIDSGTPAAMAAMVLDADRDKIKPFVHTVEQAEAWIAMELVRQSKGGKYGEMEGAGIDAKGLPYSSKFKPAELVEDDIECEIVMINMREQLQNAGIALQLTQAERPLLSIQNAQDSLIPGLVKDTDRENNRILLEELDRLIPSVKVRHLINAVSEDKKGQKELAVILDELNLTLQKLRATQFPEAQGQPSPQAAGNQIGMPRAVTPQAVTAGEQASPMQIPPEVQAAVAGPNLGL